MDQASPFSQSSNSQSTSAFDGSLRNEKELVINSKAFQTEIAELLAINDDAAPLAPFEDPSMFLFDNIPDCKSTHHYVMISSSSLSLIKVFPRAFPDQCWR